jgi:hypothetical protein
MTSYPIEMWQSIFQMEVPIWNCNCERFNKVSPAHTQVDLATYLFDRFALSRPQEELRRLFPEG